MTPAPSHAGQADAEEGEPPPDGDGPKIVSLDKFRKK